MKLDDDFVQMNEGGEQEENNTFNQRIRKKGPRTRYKYNLNSKMKNDN